MRIVFSVLILQCSFIIHMFLLCVSCKLLLVSYSFPHFSLFSVIDLSSVTCNRSLWLWFGGGGTNVIFCYCQALAEFEMYRQRMEDSQLCTEAQHTQRVVSMSREVSGFIYSGDEKFISHTFCFSQRQMHSGYM